MRCVGYRQAWRFLDGAIDARGAARDAASPRRGSSPSASSPGCARRRRWFEPRRSIRRHGRDARGGGWRACASRRGRSALPPVLLLCNNSRCNSSRADAPRAKPAHAARTLYDKLWDSHVVRTEADGTALLYIDRHLVHEVTSPQAFEGLRLAGRKPWRVASIVATADHNTPTRDWDDGIRDPISRTQVETLDANIRATGAKAYFPFRDRRQGIVHVIGPEQGATLPGMTVVCGDSHTSTHGAFAALAFGIGTSEVEHVLATQCLLSEEGEVDADPRRRPAARAASRRRTWCWRSSAGSAPPAAPATRSSSAASAVRALSMEGRMTVCNMAIEAGARAGMVAVDDTTIEYLRGPAVRADRRATGTAPSRTGARCTRDDGAKFDATRRDRRGDARAAGHLGHVARDGGVGRRAGAGPGPGEGRGAPRGHASARSTYMGLAPNTPITDIADRQGVHRLVHQLADRGPARRRGGRPRAGASRPNVKLAMVVPGSGLVKAQAEREGLDRMFRDAGFEWREPGCSMCLAMNDDRLEPGERCASTSNRNFEGRQGAGGRTHLVSPAMAAAAAIAGHFVDVRRLF